MRLIEACPTCNKPIQIDWTLKDYEFYKCGHGAEKNAPKPKLSTVDYFDTNNEDEAYEYQKIGYEFARESGFNCAITDAMGLGKTIQAEICLKNHKDELIPSLIVVKSATIGNWAREIHKWYSKDNNSVFPIIGKQLFIPVGFDQYVISMDSLKTNYEALRKFHDNVQPFKSVVVDECHSFKDDGSQRTKSLIKFLAGDEKTKSSTKVVKDDSRDFKKDSHFLEGTVKYESVTKFSFEQTLKPITHRLFLSGTPIKNKADEYFVTLNLLRPKEFYSRKSFRQNWLVQNDKGKWSHLNPRWSEEFYKKTGKFIIRREKTQVLKNLPAFRRDFTFITIDDPEVMNSYNKQLGIAENMMRAKAMTTIEILGWMARMRQLTGIAKVGQAIDFTKEFFENSKMEKSFDPNYPDKLAIGIHHKAVKDLLKDNFDRRDNESVDKDDEDFFKFNAITLSGEDSSWQKDRKVQDFNKPENKLLIVNELAGGVGLNLQSCANTLVLERQWNAADEEQFESRFHRNGQTYPVNATYIVAEGTIDEFFMEMVEDKRKIFGNTITSWEFTSDMESMKSLMQRAIDNPLR